MTLHRLPCFCGKLIKETVAPLKRRFAFRYSRRIRQHRLHIVSFAHHTVTPQRRSGDRVIRFCVIVISTSLRQYPHGNRHHRSVI
ncbi:hypothetical protein KCP70_00540 [Salmonella enterica subsp. enterica]|nr:hypothetical protein KCP70_00540 [Salmonella enterica subsp. enterica]